MRFVTQSLLLLPLAVLSAVPVVEGRNFIKARASLDALEDFFPIIREQVFPGVLNLLNKKLKSAVAEVGELTLSTTVEDIEFGVIGAGSIQGFGLNQNANLLPGIKVNSVSDRVIQVGVTASDLGITIRQLTATLQAFLGNRDQLLPQCAFSLEGQASLDQFVLNIDIGVTEDNAAVFSINDFEIGAPKLELMPNVTGVGMTGEEEPLCEVLVGPVFETLVTVFSKVANRLTPLMTEVMGPLVGTVVNTITNTVPLYIPLDFDLTDNLALSIKPSIEKFRADSSPASFIELSGGLAIQGILKGPEWRAGNSFSNDLLRIQDVPDPEVDQLINVNIGAGGLNSLIQPAWYLGWSTIATEPEALESPLCQGKAIDTDPCPFPPFIRWAGSIENILLSSVLIFRGFFTSFSYHASVPPPSIELSTQAATGTVSAQVAIMGNTWRGGVEEVAMVDVTVSATSSIPKYNSGSGFFDWKGLVDVTPEITEMRFVGRRPVRRFVMRLLKTPILRLLDEIVDRVAIERVNEYLVEALEELPFKIPDIDIPPVEMGVSSELTGAGITAMPSSDGLGSYLEFGSNLDVWTYSGEGGDGSEKEEGEPEESVPDGTSVYDTTAYQLASQVDAEPFKTYTSTIRDENNLVINTFILRVNADNSIEQFEENVWTVLPPPALT